MSEMNVRLAIAPIGWTNDDLPELGGSKLLRESGLELFTVVDFSGH